MLEELKARVANAEDPAARALALIELAEAEPIFGHRQAVVRGLLHEAGVLVDKLGEPALEGRILLRLAYVKLVDADLEGTEQLASRARERLRDDAYRTVEAEVLLARAGIRRQQLDEAEHMLAELGEQAEPETTLAAARAVAAMALAWAELALERRQYGEAEKRLEALAEAVEVDPGLLEQRFACQQARAVASLALGKFDRACHSLRDCVVIAKNCGAVEDELDMRIALGGALIERGDPIGREEAERHLQITRDTAQEHGLDALHMAALMGQAGVLAKKGQTQGALDRCLEIASSAVAKQDLPRYGAAVALMSQIYEQKGDLASAYRTFAEANASLREQLGEASKDVIRPHLHAFAERIGPEKFQEIAEQVTRAAKARNDFRKM